MFIDVVATRFAPRWASRVGAPARPGAAAHRIARSARHVSDARPADRLPGQHSLELRTRSPASRPRAMATSPGAAGWSRRTCAVTRWP